MQLRDGSELVTGNTYDKFRTRNPIAQRLQTGFLDAARGLLQHVASESEPQRVLEVGCGPGDLAAAVVPALPYVGSDIGLAEVRTMKALLRGAGGVQASAYELPFAERSFDLLLACEVLEHLEQPREALDEIARVANDWVLVSVPWEPTWRLLNVLRGSYVRQLGNTPGHLQHFSRRKIRNLVAHRFEIVAERHPLPWTMMLARRR